VDIQNPGLRFFLLARLNVQGLARRDPGLMKCILPEVGHVTVSMDLAAGEPSCTAHYSGDVNYRYATIDGIGKAPEYRDGVLLIDDIYVMVMSVSPLGREYLSHTYHNHCFPAGNFVEQWLADAEVVKSFLKKQRQFHKILCVAEGTLIRVRDRGWLPVELVQAGAEVWDGEAWVTTDGPLRTGERPVIEIEGVQLTPDHKILSKDGWRDAESLAAKAGREGALFYSEDARRFQGPRAGWRDVWSMVRLVGRSADCRQAPLRACRLWVRTCVENVRQRVRSKCTTRGAASGSNTKAARTVCASLSASIATSLTTTLSSYYEAAQRMKTSSPVRPEQRLDARPVYDLINCGPNNRFMLRNGVAAHNCLGLGYGMQPRKMCDSAYNAGYALDLMTAKGFFNAYWQLFKGVRKLADRLARQVEIDGYLVNQFGYRMTCEPRLAFNYYIQSTVSGIMHVFVAKLQALAPYALFNTVIHDELLADVPRERLDDFRDAAKRATDSLNADLRWTVDIRTGFAIGEEWFSAK
jgi:hypothetical protein